MKKIKLKTATIVAILLAALMVFSACTNPGSGQETQPEEPSTFVEVEVQRVVDGDTIIVSLDGANERVRMIGIDTPESVAPDASRNVPYGKIASAFTKEKLEGKTVELEFDVEERDQYGRILAYVYINGEMFNKTLLDEGHASVYTWPPNVKYVEVFKEAQIAAREAGKGQWSSDSGSVSGSEAEGEINYIGTTNSRKFHTMNCELGKSISEKNAAHFSTRDEALDAGFVPCKSCNP